MPHDPVRAADPFIDDLLALQEENEQLRSLLAAAVGSASYRVGHRLVRAAATVLPGRTAGQPVTVPPAGRRGGTPPPATHRSFAAPWSADDCLLDAVGAPAARVRQAVTRLREELPAHAAILVVHDDPEVVDGSETELHVEPDLAYRFRPRFGPGRTLRLLDHGEAASLLTSPPRTLVRRSTEPVDAAAGLPVGPVFIGGTGRSGTWVLGRMLAAHPRFTTVHTELRFHATERGFPATLDGRSSPSEYADRIMGKWYRPTGGSGKPKGLQLVIGPAALRTCIERFEIRAREDVPAALGQLLLDVVDPYAASRDALEWAETTPDNASAAAALTTVLPDARVVHTVRDGRDVAASVATMPWGPDTIEDGLEWWARRLRRADEGVRGAGDRAHIVRLEELINLDRDAQYRQVIDFLGFTDDAPLRTYFDEQMDGKKGNVGRWRGQVDAGQRDRIDGRYHELLDELRDEGVTSLPTDADAVDELAG